MPFKSLFQAVSGICVYYFLAMPADHRKQINTPPKVIITKPALKDRFNWNSVVRYTISISDQEDGLSEYNEIMPHEVILKTAFFPDSTKARAYMNSESKPGTEQKGLSLIKASTCFNCHAVKTKLIGPSFEAIARRYAARPDSVQRLAGKIIKGSKLVWDVTEMPPHPEIKMEDAREIVRWMIKNTTDPNINYLPGLEGAFQTKSKPSKDAGKGVYVLTANYIDHGLPQMPNQRKEGKAVLVVKSN